MADPRWERIKALFAAALDTPAADRSVFLERECGGDDELRREVESLLSARSLSAVRTAGAAHALGDAGAGASGATTQSAPISEGPGTRIGPYKLLQLIGEGGFGSVFMAEQERPVRRRVALKIIKLGMDTRAVIARFEAERQALAMMDHPNIAKVLDAGATESGRPYFVMELVRGVPITEYCDGANLTAAERLALVVPVCHAVQHAHQKGIIHRDLKPSNILVTLHDGKPVPKVIDFGIAKATASRLTEKTLFTEHRQMIGTPAYMSPEQAEMSGLDIDTRADVYSLGVLLYELLTGATPFDTRQLMQAGFAEIQRVIREVEPQKPSTRVSTLGEGLAGVAARRKVEPRRLGVLLRGDLDWIVMKALEKDRTRRYDTAVGLAEDIGRHLRGEAVEAAPASAGYRVRKFVRRNRGAVMAGTAIGVALLAGAGGSTAGFVQARQANHVLSANYETARVAIGKVLIETLRDDSGTREHAVAFGDIFVAPSGRSYRWSYRWAKGGDLESGDLSVVDLEGNPADEGMVVELLANEMVRSVRESRDLSASLESANAKLRGQAARASEGIGRMMKVLMPELAGGPFHSIREDDGKDEVAEDPLGSAMGAGIQLAETLKKERDQLEATNTAVLQHLKRITETAFMGPDSDGSHPLLQEYLLNSGERLLVYRPGYRDPKRERGLIIIDPAAHPGVTIGLDNVDQLPPSNVPADKVVEVLTLFVQQESDELKRVNDALLSEADTALREVREGPVPFVDTSVESRYQSAARMYHLALGADDRRTQEATLLANIERLTRSGMTPNDLKALEAGITRYGEIADPAPANRMRYSVASSLASSGRFTEAKDWLSRSNAAGDAMTLCNFKSSATDAAIRALLERKDEASDAEMAKHALIELEAMEGADGFPNCPWLNHVEFGIALANYRSAHYEASLEALSKAARPRPAGSVLQEGSTDRVEMLALASMAHFKLGKKELASEELVECRQRAVEPQTASALSKDDIARVLLMETEQLVASRPVGGSPN